MKEDVTKIITKDVPFKMLASQKTDISLKIKNETPASIIPKKEIIKIEPLKPIKTGPIQSTITEEMKTSRMIEKGANEISGDRSTDVISLQKAETIESKPLIETSSQSKAKGQALQSSVQTNINNIQQTDRKNNNQTKSKKKCYGKPFLAPKNIFIFNLI